MMNQLTGAWRLTEAKWTFDDGEAVNLYGEGASGRSLFTADGWMMVILTGASHVQGADAAAAPFTLAYSGRYRDEAEKFVVDVDVSSMPQWVGTAQERKYTAHGDTHTIVLGMPAHPAYGRTGRGTLKFTRG